MKTPRFNPGTTDESPGEGRSLEHYAAYLHFDPEELRGKSVLDLGSGPTERFAREIKAAGIEAFVVSLNPDYANPDQIKRLKETCPDWEGNSIAGIAEALPFKDESFDEIMALHSISYWAKKPFNLETADELMRVLRPGGKARIGPCRMMVQYLDIDEEHDNVHRFMVFVNYLRDRGMNVRLEREPWTSAYQSTLIIQKPQDPNA